MGPRTERVLARLTWLLLVASTLYLFVCPAVVMAFWFPLQGPHLEPFDIMETEAKRPHLAMHERWDWGWPVWLAPLLAVVLPVLLHLYLRRRIGSPYRVTRQPPERAGYRGAGRLRIEIDPRVARRCSAAYLTRLALAAALCSISWLVLSQGAFHVSFTCSRPLYVRTIPEHLTFSAILLAAILWHCPLRARILGRAPRLLPEGR